MSDSTNDLLSNEGTESKLPSGINVLTILTFIGCALQLIGALWSFFTAQKTFDDKDKMLEKLNSGPAWAKSMMGDPEKYIQMITKSLENKVPILLMGLVAVALCFFGALQMRKLKKQGFLFYTIGELLPFLTQFLFIGAFTFSGIGFMCWTAIVAIFILLYALQRKKLIY